MNAGKTVADVTGESVLEARVYLVIFDLICSAVLSRGMRLR